MLKVIIFLFLSEMKVYKGVAESLLNTISLIGKSEIKQEASEPRVVEHL